MGVLFAGPITLGVYAVTALAVVGVALARMRARSRVRRGREEGHPADVS